MGTAAAITASLLTIAAGSLFFESSTYSTRGELKLVGSFTSELYSSEYAFVFGVHSGTGFGVNEFGVVSSLILESNLSYPAFTYQDLAFPMLAWDETQLSDWSNVTHLTAEAIVPALRATFTVINILSLISQPTSYMLTLTRNLSSEIRTGQLGTESELM
jgi:hypothetical protein